MSRADTPMVEAVYGLAGAGQAQLDYLGYMVLQAVVVFVWWPKGGLLPMLQAGDGPDTLLAAVLAVGATVSYLSVRAGAGELRLPGQRALAGWVATSLPIARVVASALFGHVAHTVHLLALSSPLVLLAFHVCGGEWPALAWAALGIVVLAAFYWLASAVLTLAIGGEGTLPFLAVRAVLVGTYGLTALVLPPASHLRVSAALLGRDAPTPAVDGLADHVVFVLGYGGACALLAVALAALLARRRGGADRGRDGVPA